MPQMKGVEALQLLNEIPADIEPFAIIQWMRHYFPLVSDEIPETTPGILEWVIKKTTLYERSNDWPAIGIEFGKKMMEICKSVKFTFGYVP